MVERQNKWNVQTYCRLSESYRVHLFPLTTKTASPSQVLCFLYCGFRLQVLHKWVENRTTSVCAPLHHPVLVALHHRNSGGPIVLYGLPLSSGIVQVMLVRLALIGARSWILKCRHVCRRQRGSGRAAAWWWLLRKSLSRVRAHFVRVATRSRVHVCVSRQSLTPLPTLGACTSSRWCDCIRWNIQLDDSHKYTESLTAVCPTSSLIQTDILTGPASTPVSGSE